MAKRAGIELDDPARKVIISKLGPFWYDVFYYRYNHPEDGHGQVEPRAKRFIESIVDDADDVAAAANVLDAARESYHAQILGA